MNTVVQDCGQSILSNPPANISKSALLKPFQHASLHEHHFSASMFKMANSL